jgi:hypothetical protein
MESGQGSSSCLANPGCDPGLLIVKPLRGLAGNIKTIKKLKAIDRSENVSKFLTLKGFSLFFKEGPGVILQKCRLPGGGGQKPI